MRNSWRSLSTLFRRRDSVSMAPLPTKQRPMGLHAAAERGNLDHQDLDKSDDKGLTPLHLAAQNGHAKVVAFLLENRVRIDAQDNAGQTPLFFACKGGHAQVVQMLITAGAAVNLKRIDWNTPLHLAIQSGDLASVQALCAAGADVKISNMNGQLPVHMALNYSFHELSAEIIRTLHRSARTAWHLRRLLLIGRLKNHPLDCPFAFLPAAVFRKILHFMALPPDSMPGSELSVWKPLTYKNSSWIYHGEELLAKEKPKRDKQKHNSKKKKKKKKQKSKGSKAAERVETHEERRERRAKKRERKRERRERKQQRREAKAKAKAAEEQEQQRLQLERANADKKKKDKKEPVEKEKKHKRKREKKDRKLEKSHKETTVIASPAEGARVAPPKEAEATALMSNGSSAEGHSAAKPVEPLESPSLPETAIEAAPPHTDATADEEAPPVPANEKTPRAGPVDLAQRVAEKEARLERKTSASNSLRLSNTAAARAAHREPSWSSDSSAKGGSRLRRDMSPSRPSLQDVPVMPSSDDLLTELKVEYRLSESTFVKRSDLIQPAPQASAEPTAEPTVTVPQGEIDTSPQILFPPRDDDLEEREERRLNRSMKRFGFARDATK